MVKTVLSRVHDCTDASAWQQLSEVVRPIALKACASSDAETCADFPSWVISWFYERRLSAIRKGSENDPISALLNILESPNREPKSDDTDLADETAARFLFATMRDYALRDYFRERQRTRRRPDTDETRSTAFDAAGVVPESLRERMDKKALAAQVQSRIAVLPVGRRVAFRLRFFPLLQVLDDSDIEFILSRHSEIPDEERLFDVGGTLTVVREDVYALLKAEAENTGRADLPYELVGQFLGCSANTANTNVLRACQSLRDAMGDLAEWRVS